jgi:hypothetical protein
MIKPIHSDEIPETSLCSNIYEGPGFYSHSKLQFSEIEFAKIKELIKEQYLGRISEISPHLSQIFESLPLDLYHTQSSKIDHKLMWPKERRILDTESASKIQEFSVFNDLSKIFNEVVIYNQEFNWRITRPQTPEDNGPVHADSWYWDLGNGYHESKYKRIKAWCPVYNEPGLSGLLLAPDSHLAKYEFTSEVRDGLLKPVPVDTKNLNLIPFGGPPGSIIFFNDNTLHAGFSRGTRTRVSIEFTLLVC